MWSQYYVMHTPRFLASLYFLTLPYFKLARSHPTLRIVPLPQAIVMKSTFPTVGGWCEACQNMTMTQCAVAKYLASINSPRVIMSSKGVALTISMAGLAIMIAVSMSVLMYS